jgi:hypothetical protein
MVVKSNFSYVLRWFCHVLSLQQSWCVSCREHQLRNPGVTDSFTRQSVIFPLQLFSDNDWVLTWLNNISEKEIWTLKIWIETVLTRFFYLRSCWDLVLLSKMTDIQTCLRKLIGQTSWLSFVTIEAKMWPIQC